MRAPDLTSVLVAGGIGAVVLLLVASFQSDNKLSVGDAMQFGFLTGVGVQIGVRILGVS